MAFFQAKAQSNTPMATPTRVTFWTILSTAQAYTHTKMVTYIKVNFREILKKVRVVSNILLAASMKDNSKLEGIMVGANYQHPMDSTTMECSSMVVRMVMGNSEPKMVRSMSAIFKQIENMVRDSIGWWMVVSTLGTSKMGNFMVLVSTSNLMVENLVVHFVMAWNMVLDDMSFQMV